MSKKTLIVLMSGREIGRVWQDSRGHLAFAYDDAWRFDPKGFPISLSMPLTTTEHGHDKVNAFLWGLLPDNSHILESWGKSFHVSPRNAFSLLSEVGEDCAGALQFVRPERLEALRLLDEPDIQWLKETEVAERLRGLREDRSTWRRLGDTGQFSLAGAQAKTALFWDQERWGIPSGRTATTHILKPPMGDYRASVENEHFCLQLAREVGLPTAFSEVRYFEQEVAIVIERYDRLRTSDLAAAAAAEAASWAANANTGEAARGAAAAATRSAALTELAKSQPILRLHQEDFCQAFGVHPSGKYQNEGGPSPESIVNLLRTHSSRAEEDEATFIDALAFNWLIAGPDAHAKNFSILHGGGGRVRLAPLYDILSALPYLELEQIRLAMKIGGSYRIRDIGLPHWLSFAKRLQIDPDEVVERVSNLASKIPDQVVRVQNTMTHQGLKHAVIKQLADSLIKRSRKCIKLMEKAGATGRF